MSSPSPLIAVRPRHLQVVEHRLELIEHLLGGILRAGARQPLHAVEHAAQILRAKLAHRIGIERPRHLRVLAHLLGQRLHELVERRPQFVHQLLDLFIGGAALQRLAQRVLRRPQRLLGLRDIAVLEEDRHRPQPRHHVAQPVVAFGARKLPVDRTQPQIDVGFRDEPLRRDGERIECAHHLIFGIGIECEIATLLDQRARQRLAERPLRQPHLVRRRAALVVALVAGNERHRHVDAGPGMLGQILGGLPAPLRVRACGSTSVKLGASNSGRGGLLRFRLRRLVRSQLALKRRLRVDHAVVVLDLVIEQQRTAKLGFRLLGERDGRRTVRNGIERPNHDRRRRP